MAFTYPAPSLTDADTRRNWEEYGNPDGPGERSYGIALPSWIVSKENKYAVLLIYAFIILIIIPIAVVCLDLSFFLRESN